MHLQGYVSQSWVSAHIQVLPLGLNERQVHSVRRDGDYLASAKPRFRAGLSVQYHPPPVDATETCLFVVRVYYHLCNTFIAAWLKRGDDLGRRCVADLSSLRPIRGDISAVRSIANPISTSIHIQIFLIQCKISCCGRAYHFLGERHRIPCLEVLLHSTCNPCQPDLQKQWRLLARSSSWLAPQRLF